MTAGELAFRAVADATRRAILDALAAGDKSVSELCGLFEVSQPAISQHLAVLRAANLVDVRRDGRRRIYALDATPLREIYDWTAHYEHFWANKLDALGHVLDREARRAKPSRKR